MYVFELKAVVYKAVIKVVIIKLILGVMFVVFDSTSIAVHDSQLKKSSLNLLFFKKKHVQEWLQIVNSSSYRALCLHVRKPQR